MSCKLIELNSVAGFGGAFLMAIAAMTPALADDTPLTMAFSQGRPLIDLRVRYEGVDDATKSLDASALTARARLGFQTGDWNNFNALVEFDQIWAIGADSYNSTRNGKTAYPVVVDPAMTALDRLQVSYTSDFNTKFTLGRQRIIFGNSRFIGNVGWRDHEQTFDALSFVNTSITNLTVTYAYVDRVNRIFGPGAAAVAGQVGSFNSNSHLLNAVYKADTNLTLTGSVYLLDFNNKGASKAFSNAQSTATYGLRADYTTSLGSGVGAKLTGEFAHQSDYGHNPASYELDYWLAEASLSYKTFSALVGYEVLGSDGTRGFSTPLATLHAFNGWADLFLATPANGLNDLYFKASYKFNDVPFFSSITAMALYHKFDADYVSADYGDEWDAQIDYSVDKNLAFQTRFAVYSGAGPFADRSVGWLMASYVY